MNLTLYLNLTSKAILMLIYQINQIELQMIFFNYKLLSLLLIEVGDKIRNKTDFQY